MPEKIAHKRIIRSSRPFRTLCLLSLVFGGLLWPIAWLWAYTNHRLQDGLRHRQASRLLRGPDRRSSLNTHLIYNGGGRS